MASKSVESRLKVTRSRLVSADGVSTSFPDTIHDNLLDVDCTFQEVFGQWYCFPVFATLERGNWFLDTSCTQRFAFASYCSGDLKYASSRNCYWNEVYNVKPIKEMVNDVYSVLEDGSCVASMNPYAGFGFQFYSVGAEIKQTEFVLAVRILAE